MDPPPPHPPPRFDSPLRAVSGTTKQLQHTKHLQRPAQQQQQQHQQQQQTTQRRQQQQHTQRRGSSSRSRPPSASSSSSSSRRPGACRAQRSSAQRSSGSSSSSTSSRPPEARLAFVHPLWPQVDTLAYWMLNTYWWGGVMFLSVWYSRCNSTKMLSCQKVHRPVPLLRCWEGAQQTQ